MPPRMHLEDQLFFRALFISLLVAASALPATPYDDVSETHFHLHQRRHLASSLPSPSNSGFLAAAHPANRDWGNAPDAPPTPELYYQDLDDGSRQLIWAFDDTLARDVLTGEGRPQVWLHAIVEVQTHGELLLLFLEHYSRLGINPDRMLVTLRHDPLSSSSANAASRSLSKTQRVLNAFGADHRIWLGSRSAAAELEALLLAVRRVPVRDWVLAVRGHEFADFGGMLAAHFLQRQELRGANWIVASPEERLAPSGRLEPLPSPQTQPSLWSQFPLACSIPPQNASKDSAAAATVVVAFRGYLRPSADRSTVVAAETAADYFGAPGQCGWSRSLYELTPYFSYWRYYKTPLMVGNAYLWRERQADDVIALQRFRWHARAPAESTVQAGNEGFEGFEDERRYRRCTELSAEELKVQGLLSSGEALVGEGKMVCEAGSKAAPRLLPLSTAAAEALRRAVAELIL